MVEQFERKKGTRNGLPDLLHTTVAALQPVEEKTRVRVRKSWPAEKQAAAHNEPHPPASLERRSP